MNPESQDWAERPIFSTKSNSPGDGRRGGITGSPLIPTSLALQLHLNETCAHRGS
jgi:hypothetical protein